MAPTNGASQTALRSTHVRAPAGAGGSRMSVTPVIVALADRREGTGTVVQGRTDVAVGRRPVLAPEPYRWTDVVVDVDLVARGVHPRTCRVVEVPVSKSLVQPVATATVL